MDHPTILAPKDVAPLRRRGQLGPAPSPVLDGYPIRGGAIADALPHSCEWAVSARRKHGYSAGRAAWGDAATAYDAVWCQGAA